MMGYPETDPNASGLHAEWYAANIDAGAVCAQRCLCGVWRHPARYFCRKCSGDQWTFEPLPTNDAVIESWTITRRPLHFGFAEVVPYAIVVARTECGRFFVHVRPSIGNADEVPIGASLKLFVDTFGVPYSELA